MTNRPNVQVRLRALELLFRHGASLSGVAGCLMRMCCRTGLLMRGE
jgi:hypothetical protein